MPTTVVKKPFVIEVVPAMSSDPYLAGDAFGAKIDLTPFIPRHPDQLETTFEPTTIQVVDVDKQKADFDLYFYSRDTDDFTDIPDNDIFDPVPSDSAKLVGPVRIVAADYVDLQDESHAAPSKFSRFKIKGRVLFMKVVIRSNKTYTSTSSVKFIIQGILN